MIRVLWLTLFFALISAQPAFSETRAALVVGNSTYEHVPYLPNAQNDASDIGDALERIGFDVTRGIDLDYREMRLLLRDFSRSVSDADKVIIYFAGHGVEINNTNYLIPTNAELRSDQDIEFEAVRLDALINAVSTSQGLKLVLVDACRNNPFLVDMVRTSATRSVGRGLARVNPGGVLVGYAARSGTLALDGTGRNSPYAHAILQHVEEPGLELGKLFRKVRDTVLSSTAGHQEPFTYGSLPAADIFLVPAALPEPTPDSIAEEFINAALNETVEDWDAFLERFGKNNAHHQLYALAQKRRQNLTTRTTKSERSGGEKTVNEDELVAFAAAEKLGSARAWALYFQRFPHGTMKRSALLQEHEAFMTGLRDRVWGRYHNTSVGREMTPAMRRAALEMISVNNTQVTRIQNALVFSRIDIGGIDGQLGPRTQLGLEQFQAARSMPVTGLPTRATMAAMTQAGSWGSSGKLEFTPDIFPTSGAVARVLDPDSIRILEQDPRLDRLVAALPGHEIVYGFFEGGLYAAINLGTTFGRSDLARIEEKAGGKLVEFESAAEQEFVRALVRFDQKLWGTVSVRSNLGPAIGLEQNNGQWVWRSGAPLTFTNWAPGEPKRLPEATTLDESYGRLVPRDQIRSNKTRVEQIGWASSHSLSPTIILELK